MWLIRFLYWLHAFISPIILLGFIGIVIGKENLLYGLLVAGAIAGVIFAERIRRKFGLENFFGRISGSNTVVEKKKKIK